MNTFKSLQFSGNEVLTRAQQRNVKGGMCAAQMANGDIQVFNNATGNLAPAQALAAQQGTHWCCDSCGQTSWFGPMITPRPVLATPTPVFGGGLTIDPNLVLDLDLGLIVQP